MKLNLKASAYCSMVERNGELVLMSERDSNKVLMVVGKVGAHSSLLKYVTKYSSANTKYTYNTDVYCCGKLLGTTYYSSTSIDAGEYSYTDSIAMYSSLA